MNKLNTDKMIEELEDEFYRLDAIYEQTNDDYIYLDIKDFKNQDEYLSFKTQLKQLRTKVNAKVNKIHTIKTMLEAL